MPDIQLRFHRDMLVLSSPISHTLARRGFDAFENIEYANLIEPETVQDALRLDSLAGAQCLVANTADITPAQLAHRGLEDRAEESLCAALNIARELKPQHLFVEVGPCGLPLDASSKASLNENRGQYAAAARFCSDQEFDAFFLNGFSDVVDLKCALMGVRQISDVPVIASINIDANAQTAGGRHTLEEALQVMVEYEASAAGFLTAAPIDKVVAFTKRACEVSLLPLLVQLFVEERPRKRASVSPDDSYACPDALVDAAARLRAAGAQFLRAVGHATPAYTGALVAASEGLNVLRSDIEI